MNQQKMGSYLLECVASRNRAMVDQNEVGDQRNVIERNDPRDTSNPKSKKIVTPSHMAKLERRIGDHEAADHKEEIYAEPSIPCKTRDYT
jgi:hypothetical protein